MSEINWRKGTEIVATLDLGLTVMEFIFASIALPIMLIHGINASVEKSHGEIDGIPMVIGGIVAITVALIIFVVAKTKGAIYLRIATEQETDAEESLDLCRTWADRCIIVLIIYCGIYLLTLGFTMMAIALLARGAFLFIVYKFYMELEIFLKPIYNPTGTREHVDMTANIIQMGPDTDQDGGRRCDNDDRSSLATTEQLDGESVNAGNIWQRYWQLEAMQTSLEMKMEILHAELQNMKGADSGIV